MYKDLQIGSILLHKIKNGSTVGKTLILTIENKGVGSSSNSLFLKQSMKHNGTIQRSTKNDSKLFTIKDKKTEGAIKNGQSRDTGNIGYTRHRMKTIQRHGQHWVHKTQDKDNPETLATLGTQDTG